MTPQGRPLRIALIALAWICAQVGLAHAQSIVIDDQDGPPGFTTTGNDWTTWGMLGFGLDGADTEYHYLSHTVGGSDRVGTATWTPVIPTAGTWEISTWFRLTENRTPDADHVITDGTGATSAVVLNQIGEGASGWVDLGTYWCAEGSGGCTVTLDGTDDNHSDEANAVRFVLVSPDPPPGDDDDTAVGDDDDADPCDSFGGLGDHTQTVFAGSVAAQGWNSTGAGQGAPDGSEAHSGNVDAGEFISGSGFPLCDPLGDDVITSVEIGVRARTQYASGPYDILLDLHAGGATTTWHDTNLSWQTVDVTGDQAAWSWSDAAALVPTLVLNSHPNGNRDSDAWVDAFRVRVEYTTTSDPFADDDDAVADDDDVVADDDDAVSDDDDAVSDDDDAVADDEDLVVNDDDAGSDNDEGGLLPPGPSPAEGEPSPEGSGCWQSVDGLYAGLLMLPLATRRRSA